MTIGIGSPIAVVGAGAIGCYFGGMLARAGANVTLIGRHQHVDAIKRDGLLLQSREFSGYIPVAATEHMAAVGGAGLVLFCVKSADTDDAAWAMAPQLAADAAVLSLQNGVNNVERIRRHVKAPVIAGLVYAAAEMSGPGAVRHTGGGSLVIGRLDALPGDRETDPRLLSEIAALFTGAGIAVKISAEIATELWSKLVMNCAYNAISALSRAPYGRMVALPEIREVMRQTVDEVVQVARAKGIRLPGDMVDAAFRLADAMPATLSSTAQDILKGKRTEIDHLNGYVVREGEALGIPTPANRTLNALVKLLELTASGRSG
ncbi:MAG TPA: 2-dehydropantoate 2-reductase [Xanthobacteraceae bacterium]|jgi:2-dehydropantoate 2-reductase|nr:2-dehydropantoate 2-reductase [Xanthobacteraceae bacterium]